MPARNTSRPSGMVYIMTNSSENNAVAAFRRKGDGTLSLMNLYSTRGQGTGTHEVSDATPDDGVDTLASQGSLVLSGDRNLLFAVNAGSHSISSFKVAEDGTLALVDTVLSGGLQPNCLGVHRDVLYVANVGGPANGFASNISGYYVSREGRLAGIMASSRLLSTQTAQPACVVFSPDGSQLAVTELTTNHISVYRINRDGTAAGPMVNDSSGSAPFGAVFLPSGLLLVAEAGANALTSYSLFSNGMLRVISGSVRNGQMATCWVAHTPNGSFAYTSNAGSGTISAYRLGANGELSYLDSVGSTPSGTVMGVPIDIGVSRDGQNLYALNGNQGSISVFSIGANGRLSRIQVIDRIEIPNLGAQGLAVL